MSAVLTDADLKRAYTQAQALTESETPRAAAIKQAIIEATPYLREFKDALQFGKLVICCQCVKFTFAERPAEIGACREHGEAWPFVPFTCGEFVRRKKLV